jgi:AcrR family transcriptional regulator
MSGTGRKKVAREDREREMLEVAGSVFARRGFHAASMDEIADGAGVSKPMFYRYFGSKEQLYYAYVAAAGNRLLSRMRAAVAAAGDDPEERLAASARAFFAHVREHRDGWSVLFGELAARGAPFAREILAIRERIVQGTADLFEEVLERAGGDGSAVGGTEPLAVAFVGAGESLGAWLLAHPEEPADAVADRLMNVAWLGLHGLLERRGSDGLRSVASG